MSKLVRITDLKWVNYFWLGETAIFGIIHNNLQNWQPGGQSDIVWCYSDLINADLINVTEEVTIHRPNILTLLSSAFIRGDLNAATRGPFIWSLISGLFSDEV